MGYTGSKYNPRLTASEVSKLVKQEIQAKYPQAEVSVSKNRYSGGWSLNVEIKDCGFNPYEPDYDGWDSKWFEKHPDSKSFLNTKAQTLIEACKAIIAAYNYNHSDAMSDYFDVGFYSSVALIGWSHILLYLKESTNADYLKRNYPEYINWVNKRLEAKAKHPSWKTYLLKLNEPLQKI